MPDVFDAVVPVVLERASRAAVASPLHGVDHWRRVAAHGRALVAETPAADGDVVAAFAALHDACRKSDGRDPRHGDRAADLAADLHRDGLLPLDDAHCQALDAALRDHDRGRTSTDATIGTCWDADRLDLPRIGVQIDRAFLSTRAARSRVTAPEVTTDGPVGWRVWAYVAHAGSVRLISPKGGHIHAWDPGQAFVAACQHGHTPPHPRCTCGVYIAPNVSAALEYGGESTTVVAGRVRLNGRILGGAKAGEWRGQYATILDLYLRRSATRNAGLARWLGEAYGVRCRLVEPDEYRALGSSARALSAEQMKLAYDVLGLGRRPILSVHR